MTIRTTFRITFPTTHTSANVFSTASKQTSCAMDGGLIAAVIILVLLLAAIVVTAPFISRKLEIDTAVVIIIGILFWPAWLIMLLVAAGKHPHTETVAVVHQVGAAPQGAPLPSLSNTVLSDPSLAS